MPGAINAMRHAATTLGISVILDTLDTLDIRKWRNHAARN
jgi:hypothetical protein